MSCLQLPCVLVPKSHHTRHTRHSQDVTRIDVEMRSIFFFSFFFLLSPSIPRFCICNVELERERTNFNNSSKLFPRSKPSEKYPHAIFISNNIHILLNITKNIQIINLRWKLLTCTSLINI